MSALAAPTTEAVERFACFGGTCSVLVQGSGPAGSAAQAVERARRRMLEWHAQFSRFEPASELSLLNGDARETVPVSATMARFVEAALFAASLTDGLVDPTLVDEVERAGYVGDLLGATADVPMPVAAAPVPLAARVGQGRIRRPAAAHPAARWRLISVERHAGTVTRPVGVRLDSGGIAKGLFGDVLAQLLSLHESFAVEAAGDIRLGGAAGVPREIRITSPFDDARVLHTFELAAGAVATSGTTKRTWIGRDGRLAHHLLDPSSGEPAHTGIVQATALAPSGVEAEALAKAALLAGPTAGRDWLAHGGLLAYDDGAFEVIAPAPRPTLRLVGEGSLR